MRQAKETHYLPSLVTLAIAGEYDYATITNGKHFSEYLATRLSRVFGVTLDDQSVAYDGILAEEIRALAEGVE